LTSGWPRFTSSHVRDRSLQRTTLLRWHVSLGDGLIYETLVRVLVVWIESPTTHVHRIIPPLKLMSTEHTGVPDDFAFDSPR
jgi:hypothetical protein